MGRQKHRSSGSEWTPKSGGYLEQQFEWHPTREETVARVSVEEKLMLVSIKIIDHLPHFSFLVLFFCHLQHALGFPMYLVMSGECPARGTLASLQPSKVEKGKDGKCEEGVRA